MGVMRSGRQKWRPIKPLDTFAVWTQPVTLAPGHPLRGSACLLCHAPIAGRPARFTSIIVATTPGCTCGQVPTITQLICAHHELPDGGALIDAAVELSVAAHPDGEHQCKG